MKVIIDKECKDILLFNKVGELKRVNILFGGNGVGKSTFLRYINEDKIRLDTDSEVLKFNYINSYDNSRAAKGAGRHSNDSFLEKISIKDVNEIYNASSFSEGQSIVYFMIDFFNNLEKEIVKEENMDKEVVVTIDEMDSGLSAENINFLCHILCDISNNFPNVTFFISANHYHFIYVFKEVLNMYNGKFEKINSYEEFFSKLNDGIAIMSKSKKRNFDFLR